MASFSKHPKTGKYRIRFILNDQNKTMMLPTADKSVADTICSMVTRLEIQHKTGEPDRKLSNWLKEIPDDLRQRLERAGLVEVKLKSKTIQDIIDRFQNRQDVEPSTLLTYGKISSNLTAFFKSNCLLESIDTEQAARFYSWLKKRYAEATAKRRINLTKQFFTEAVRLDWIIKNPFRFCKGGDVVNKEKWQYFPVDVVSKALDEILNKEHRAQIALMRFAGVRGASELYQMDWTPETIRWSSGSGTGSITILADKTKKHEGKDSRIIPLNPALESCLRDLYDSANEGQVKMFPKMRKTSNPGNWIKKAFNQAGINIGQVYNLRRSYCCDVMEAVGQDAKAYEALTGHSFQMGLKHYQQYHKARQDKAEGRLMEFWSKLGLDSEKVSIKVSMQGGTSDNSELQAGGDSIPQVPEIQGFLQNKKTSCYGGQNVQEIKKWAKLDLSQNAENPVISRVEQGSADGRFPSGFPFSDKIELILSLIDSLNFEEKERLFDRLDSVER